MAFSYASNSAALKAKTALDRTTSQLSTTFERLSTGLRINRASDDPAGLAVADALRRDSKIATVAMRNASDGISIASIADGALSEISSVLYRMSELAEQSANGAITNTQRSAMESEFLALGSEVERISKTTTFNDINLLSNSSNVTIQVGFDSSSDSQITMTGVLSTLSSLGLASSGSSKLTYSLNTDSEVGSTYSSALALSAISTAIDTLSSRRGTIGAAESRLNFALSNLAVMRENFVAAESQIRDADIAFEVAEQVRLQVLQEAGTAVLAQANLQPERLLSLLR